MSKIDQTQQSGDHSVNIQTQNLSVGVSYDQARQIALDVYRANALELAETAKVIAVKRAEEITDDFLQKLRERQPEAIQAAVRPDFQYALFDAQKAYARTGDRELGGILVELLISRVQQPERSLRELVLAECIQVVPRLTQQQIDTITVVFILRYTRNNGLGNIDRFCQWFEQAIGPLATSLTKAEPCYQHLAYSGAATIEIISIALGDLLRQVYPGIFSKGFSRQDVAAIVDSPTALDHVLLKNPRNENSVQLPELPEDVATNVLTSSGLTQEQIQRLLLLQKNAAMLGPEIYSELGNKCPIFKTVADIWSSSRLQSMQLTSVGMAIGHANNQRRTQDPTPLSIWIP